MADPLNQYGPSVFDEEDPSRPLRRMYGEPPPPETLSGEERRRRPQQPAELRSHPGIPRTLGNRVRDLATSIGLPRRTAEGFETVTDLSPPGMAYDAGHQLIGPGIVEGSPSKVLQGAGWTALAALPTTVLPRSLGRYAALAPRDLDQAAMARMGHDFNNRLLERVEAAFYGPPGSAATSRRPVGTGAKAGDVPERGGLSGGPGGVPPQGGASDPYTPIPGQPATVNIPGHGLVEARPIPQIEAAGRAHARNMGLEYNPPTAMPPFSPDRARRIAAAFEAMRHDPSNPAAIRAYNAMMDETMAQYRALLDQGFEFRFNRPGEDPYRLSPALGYLDMRDRGRLHVFPTLEGFGSGAALTREQIANNPLLRDSGVQISGQPATMNDIFRAVHDAFGHNGPGNPFFRWQGEDRAFRHHAPLYTPEALPAITPELRGQNSWLNWGPHGERNRTASAADTIYADQKINVMPPWVHEDVWSLGQRPPEDFLRMYGPPLPDRARGGRARAGGGRMPSAHAPMTDTVLSDGKFNRPPDPAPPPPEIEELLRQRQESSSNGR